MNIPEKSFASHILRYVGVGLISGSIVHAGTLGGDISRYLILIALGIIAFTVGTYLENENKIDKKFISFILISIIVSIGTGMVSGGTQHYLDGPVFASIILPIGLLISYVAYLCRDFRDKVSVKRIVVAILLTSLLGIGLYTTAHQMPELEEHHSLGEIYKIA